MRGLMLMGGADYWSNGIHLGQIEAAASPADESWRNINAIDDLVRDIIETTDRVVVANRRGIALTHRRSCDSASARGWSLPPRRWLRSMQCRAPGER